MTKRVMYTIIAASAVLAASAGLPVLRGIGQTDSVSAVATYRVVRGEFVRRVYAEGNLEAVKASQLSPPPQVRGPLKIAWLAAGAMRIAANNPATAVVLFIWKSSNCSSTGQSIGFVPPAGSGRSAHMAG